MLSSFNVIKNTSINPQGDKKIETDFETAKRESFAVSSTTEASYNNLANTILENAKRQSEQILSKSVIEAQKIQQEAYNKGYEDGKRKAYEDAFNQAYQEHIISAQRQAEEIITNANVIMSKADELLNSSKEVYEEYLLEKKQEIKSLAIEIAKVILKKEIEAEHSIDNMVMEALNKEKSAKTFIIKSNAVHVDSLRKSAGEWKQQLTFKCEIFVVVDNTLETGNVIIEKDNGKIEVGINVGLDKVKQVLEEND